MDLHGPGQNVESASSPNGEEPDPANGHATSGHATSEHVASELAASEQTAGEHAAGEQTAEPARRNSRTGRNLPVAIGVGLLLGGFVILTLFTVKSTFLIMMGAAVGIGIWELDRALHPREIRLPLIPLYAGGAAIWACAYWLGYRPAFGALGLTIVALFGWRLHGPAAGYLRDVTAAMFALAWLAVAGGFVAMMLSQTDGAHRAFMFIVLTVCSDIGGYFAGIGFGKHLFVPSISPNKTWEGVTGSAAACLLAGGLLFPVLFHHGHAWQGLLLGAAVVAVATMGDLVESMIKRDLGIKDMGSLLPGHGGVLDRIDAMLVTAPVTWVLLTVFLPH